MSTQPSETPRTDAELIPVHGILVDYVDADFARTLERELAARDALIGEYETALRKIKDKAKALQKIPYGPDGDCGADRLANLIEEDAERALMKALRRADGKEGSAS